MEQIEKIERMHKKFVTLCGRILLNTDPQYFPRAQYRGRTIYFCTESCLGAFLADPEIFYKVHRKSKKTNQVQVEEDKIVE
jgi:YHS domain-containing protein